MEASFQKLTSLKSEASGANSHLTQIKFNSPPSRMPFAPNALNFPAAHKKSIPGGGGGGGGGKGF